MKLILFVIIVWVVMLYIMYYDDNDPTAYA